MKDKAELGRIAEKRGHDLPDNFCSAVDRLQEAGFVTELWVDLKHQILTLRWVKKGAKWHVTIQGFKNVTSQLDQIGKNANHWCRARELGTGNEQNYAVSER